MKDLWVIIPAHNEQKYLKTVLEKTKKITSNTILVDDGSTDKTPKIARKYLNNVLIHELNLGKGAAMKTGSDYAFQNKKAKAVVFLDADDQHDPEEIKEFEKSLEEGADVVFGVRQIDANIPLMRYLGNKAASIIINLLVGGYFADIPSGYKAMTKKAYQEIRWSSQGYEVETEIAVKVAKSSLKVKEIPIKTIYHDTDKGMTFMGALQVLLKLPQWVLK